MAENIEYTFVGNNLPEKPCRIFNFGSRLDKTVETFTKRGYTVVGVDLEEDDRAIENYEFHKGNFLKMDLKEKFKCIYAISSVEHVGLPYGNFAELDEIGDIKAVKKLYNMLEEGGNLLVTVPYGAFLKDDTWRVYDKERLLRLVGEYSGSCYFYIALAEYFIGGWRAAHGMTDESALSVIGTLFEKYPMVSQEDAEKVYSVVCIKIRR